jgi:hypothetical protein
MARQLSDLTVQLSGAPVSFRWPDNEAFLNGTRPHPHLDIHFVEQCASFVLDGVLVLFICGIIAYIAVWHSPLAVETTAMIDDYRDGEVSYHYFAGSTRYDKIEPASRFEPTWDSVEPTHPVIYLAFSPSRFSTSIFHPTFPSGSSL